VRQHPWLSVQREVADEQAQRPLYRRNRPTSCTAWNYHGSGIGNVVSLAAVFLRNFHQAYMSAKGQGLPVGTYYPLVHCGTSFGNYKEMRIFLMHSAELREQVKKILGNWSMASS
jgi:heterodisulfide reductase subunit B